MQTLTHAPHTNQNLDTNLYKKKMSQCEGRFKSNIVVNYRKLLIAWCSAQEADYKRNVCL